LFFSFSSRTITDLFAELRAGCCSEKLLATISKAEANWLKYAGSDNCVFPKKVKPTLDKYLADIQKDGKDLADDPIFILLVWLRITVPVFNMWGNVVG
jgi:hypothetical protein